MHERGRPRIEVNYPVTLSGEGGNGSGTMTNLTITGGEIDSDLHAQIGAHFRVHIQLSGARSPIDIAIATVRWQGDHRFGVEFVRFEGNAKAQLEEMLNQSDTNSAP
ncbi:MAG: PilZ domain-containing protein [Nitrospira sp.]|nr:PilZ domain-containing protein [Nitrospira sp.]